MGYDIKGVKIFDGKDKSHQKNAPETNIRPPPPPSDNYSTIGSL